jgi:hypothetical protein
VRDRRFCLSIIAAALTDALTQELTSLLNLEEILKETLNGSE